MSDGSQCHYHEAGLAPVRYAGCTTTAGEPQALKVPDHDSHSGEPACDPDHENVHAAIHTPISLLA